VFRCAAHTWRDHSGCQHVFLMEYTRPLPFAEMWPYTPSAARYGTALEALRTQLRNYADS
jgi:hypothetical protein